MVARDDLHMWLAPFTAGRDHLIFIIFQLPVTIAVVRIWVCCGYVVRIWVCCENMGDTVRSCAADLKKLFYLNYLPIFLN